MKGMKTPLLARYKNGNAKIFLFEDGTRVIDLPDDEKPNFEFPISMDLKITNWCDMGCPMCHEMSNKEGKHGDIMNLKFIDKLHAGTEIAIGGGKVTSHPDLIPFLKKLKELGIKPSITVHQNEYLFNQPLIDSLIADNLIYGLGVSFSNQDNILWEKVFDYPNTVAHVIAGYHGKNVFDYLKKFDSKILILGYKHWGRGEKYYNKEIDSNIEWLEENLEGYLSEFKVVSFDNLAIEQLNVKKLLSDGDWKMFYQGDDGTMTMYVDGVKEQFAKTSTSSVRYDLKDNIEDMFGVIKKGVNNG